MGIILDVYGKFQDFLDEGIDLVNDVFKKEYHNPFRKATSLDDRLQSYRYTKEDMPDISDCEFAGYTSDERNYLVLKDGIKFVFMKRSDLDKLASRTNIPDEEFEKHKHIQKLWNKAESEQDLIFYENEKDDFSGIVFFY